MDVHDDVIKWKYFPRHWRFVWGIHRLPVNFPRKGQWRGALMFSLIYALNKPLSTLGDMELERFFNENLNLKNLTHSAIANMICHERYGTLPPIPVIIWCYCSIYQTTKSNKSKKSVENVSDSNWNGPISSCVCDVTIIRTSWVNQPRGYWFNFYRITQIRKCKLVFWTLFQSLSRSNTCRPV